MKSASQEYLAIGSDGKLVQITFKVSTEQMHIDAIKLFRSYGMEIPEELISRAEIAINRLIQYEARHAKC